MIASPAITRTGQSAPQCGPFELVRVLGAGGMGTVYEAVDRVLRRPVALKLLAGSQVGQVDRLLEEARAVARLDHPNVVTVYQVGRQGGASFIAMQLVRGASAAAVLRQRGPLPVREACRVVRQAAEGLAAAHAQGLVHRDVKPANVLLGDDGSVKVADFGLAREACVATSTAGAGTPDFMSPEQAQGLPVDERADVYGLGATFYCLLTGAPPFIGASAVEVMLKHVYNAPPDPRLVRPDVPEPVARLVLWALAKRPEDRPAGVAVWAAELDQFLSAAEPAVVPARSGRRALALALAAAVLPLAGALSAVLALSPPDRHVSVSPVSAIAKESAVGPPHFEESALEAAPANAPAKEEEPARPAATARPHPTPLSRPTPAPTTDPVTSPVRTSTPPRPKRAPAVALVAAPRAQHVTPRLAPLRPRPTVRVPHVQPPAHKLPAPHVSHTSHKPHKPHHGKH